jgi:hypothetical protein
VTTARLLVLLSFLVTGSGCASAWQEGSDMNLEQSVCGLKEPLVFWLWSSMAGSPDANRLAGLQNVEDISFETKDNRVLRGYRLKATGSDGLAPSPRGYLLVMQGNAILADQIVNEFTRFSSAGFDVYIYDFRGYGRSGGRRRLKAIISDYAEILSALDSAGYAQRLVYAMSFGGIAFLDGFEQHGRLDRIIVDSAPSRLSDYGCSPEYDPVNHLPDDCGHFLFIGGEDDRVVPLSMSRELMETAQQRGAVIIRDEAFAHPFMDRDRSVHDRRMRLIGEYLINDGIP